MMMISCGNSISYSLHEHSIQSQSNHSRRQLLHNLVATTSLVTSPIIAPFFTPRSSAATSLHEQQQSFSSTPSTLRRQYDSYAANYDQLDGGAAADALGFPDLRSQLLSHANGSVLEIAVGTGLNLQYYRPDRISSFTAIDLSPGMLSQARQKASNLGFSQNSSSFQQADVTNLPFQDALFDTVVDTFSLCVFSDPLKSLESMARVVKSAQDGGKVLLLEHSKSRNPLVGWYQDVTAETVASMGKGCYWNQDVGMMLENVGMIEVERKEHFGGLIVSIIAEKKRT